MKLLIIVGSDLSINSSANLCHCAYINGFLENGCEVDLITKKENNNANIRDILPDLNKIYEVKGQAFYEKLSNMKKNKNDNSNKSIIQNNDEIDRKKLSSLKQYVRSLYGVYDVTIAWYREARKLKLESNYDLVVSITYPPVSHLLAYDLIKKKKINTKKWIQIWEDPWSEDIIFKSLNNQKMVEKAKKEEQNLVSYADEVIYVSPITLSYQQKLFTKYKNKMKWFPVPSYYSDLSDVKNQDNLVYGYFGDYNSQIRNLEVFYKAAMQEKIHVNICGNTDLNLKSTDEITIYPRLTIDDLKKIEDKTNVLVFLCNLRGGQIPGKIYQYAATNKPILFILDGTDDEKEILYNYFSKFHRFVFCDNNIEDVSYGIRKIQTGDFGDINNKVLNNFSPKNITYKIINGEAI